MKKILSTAVATALLSTAAFAEEQKMPDFSKVKFDTNAIYASAAVAIQSVTDMDSGVALIVTGGVPFMEINDKSNLAAEVEISQSIVDPSSDITIFNTTISTSVSITTFAAYAAYSYDINPQMFAKVKAGLLYESLGGDADSSDTGISYGIQGGYNLNSKMAVTVGLDIIEADVMNTYVGVQYKY